MALPPVVFVEEELTVVAVGGKSLAQQAEDQLVGMGGGGVAHFLEHGRVDAQVVVLDVGALHADGAFIELVGDDVAVFLHVLDGAVAHPFCEFRELAQPAVGIAGIGAGDSGSDLLPVAGRAARAPVLSGI